MSKTRLLKRGGLPGKTLLCANDRFAFGAMAAAFAAGLKIGRAEGCDIRIAGMTIILSAATPARL